MRSHDFADRTLPPTERHRRAVRDRGEVPRSTELTVAVQFLAISCLLWSTASSFASHLALLMSQSLSTQPSTSFDIASVNKLAEATIQTIAYVVSPIAVALIVIG